MKTKIVFIVWALVSLCQCWPFKSTPFDADVDICENPDLSGGVVSEDGETYLFKGKYYWQTRPLNNQDSGIVGYATLISSKWPEITDKMKLVFTITQNIDLITIFVVGDVWFGYQNGLKTMDGSTDYWPEFKDLKVTTALSPKRGGHLVYILHSDNNKYILYDFTFLSKPNKVRSGFATIRSNFLLFTEDGGYSMPGESLKSLINVRAVLTYNENMFLISRDTFCAVDLTLQSFERECNVDDVNQILGCPLDLSRRPVTTTTIRTTTTTTTTTEKTIISSETTTIEELISVSETSYNNFSVEELFPSEWQFSESTGDTILNGVIRTGIPILGRELEEEKEDFKINKTDQSLAPGFEAAIFERNRQNSEFWVIVIIISTLVIAVASILVVGVVSRAKKKRTKGQDLRSLSID